MISRRQFILTGIAAAAGNAFAQDAYPSRAIRVIVPHAAGGGVDTSKAASPRPASPKRSAR
jgi:tripartite-type tricarboxylate transporter receptor subunit TctC